MDSRRPGSLTDIARDRPIVGLRVSGPVRVSGFRLKVRKQDDTASARPTTLTRPAALAPPLIAGLKVRWTDAERLLAAPWPVPIRMLEVHLEPADLMNDGSQVVETFAPLADRFLLAIHQPHTVETGEALDPVARDPAVRRASLGLLAAASEVGAAIDASFLVVHPGGARRSGEPTPDLAEVRAWLAAFESPTPVVLENVPSWYHFADGSTGISTVGRTIDELLALEDEVAGFCLDVSHGWGAIAPGSEQNVRSLLALGERIRHVHASGAAAPDREGIPFAESAFGADILREVARAVGPNIACVPEIRGGHEMPRLFADALADLEAAGCFSPS